MSADSGGLNSKDIPNNSGTGVQFNEIGGSESSYTAETSTITGWVIRYSGGLVIGKKQASYVLIGIVVASVIVSFFLIFTSGNEIEELLPYEDTLRPIIGQ